MSTLFLNFFDLNKFVNNYILNIGEEYEIKNDIWHWTVLRANCTEISICSFPAYPQTEIQAREKQKEHRLEMRRKALKTKLEGIKC